MAIDTRGSGFRTAPPHLVRSYLHWWMVYRRVWRGSVVSTFLVPFITLVGLGYGLGALLKQGGGFDGVDYLVFLGPGLLATTAMSTAEGESTWPVLGSVRWDRSYEAMLATALGTTDVLLGHLTWILVRVALTSTAFLGVLVVLTIPTSWEAVLTVPFAVAVGFAFAAPIMGFSARTENEEHFALLFRFVFVPLQLFSGAFFPINQLPSLLQAIARVTPIWHGVELCRSATLGTLAWWPTLGHLAYLLVWGAAGLVVSSRIFRRVLVI